jgi:hypothetical protein
MDAWRYARLESAHLSRPASPAPYAVGLALRPAAKFAYRLLIDGGWRDGWRGLAKIALDAGSDALVWLLVARGAAGASTAAQGQNGTSSRGGAHFGKRSAGPPKVVAVAGRGAEAAAARWLRALADGGVDVALVWRGEASAETLPGQRLRRLTPLRAARALDVEMQIRTIDAVVAFGARARLTLGLLPRALRPSVAGVDAGAEPSEALARLRLRSS